MLICIIFKINLKNTPLYIHSRYLLYTLHLDIVANEAVVVLIVRTSDSIEFCVSFAVCLIALPQVTRICIYMCVYVLYVCIETLQTALCILFKAAPYRFSRPEACCSRHNHGNRFFSYCFIFLKFYRQKSQQRK